MAITATLALTSGGGTQVVAGQPAVFYVTVSNSGASDVTLTGLNTVVSAPGAIVSQSQGPVAPQTTVTVAAAGTANFPVTVVYPAPATAGTTAAPAAYSPTFVQVSTSDGSVAATQTINVFVQSPIPGHGNALPDAQTFIPGQLDFSIPANSALFPIFY